MVEMQRGALNWLHCAARVGVAVWMAIALTAGSAGAEDIACNEGDLRLGGGCRFCIPGQTCQFSVCRDILCDASCGAECVYEVEGLLIFEGTLRSNGPAIRFTGFGTLDFVGISAKDPAVEVPVGGAIRIDLDTLRTSRSLLAPGGTIEANIDQIEGRGAGALDASGQARGGAVHILRSPDLAGLSSGFLENIRLYARGLGPGAPGGQVSVSPEPYIAIREGGALRIDVSGASGGAIRLPAVDQSGGRLDLRARGRETDGGSIEIDGRQSVSSGPRTTVEIGRCTRVGSWLAGHGARVRLDGRRRGGHFTALGQKQMWICNPINASGGEQGGSVLVQSFGAGFEGRAGLARATVRGRRGPGGLVRLVGSDTLSWGRIDFGGDPEGGFELVEQP